VLVWAQSIALLGSLPAAGAVSEHADTMECVLCELALSSGDASLIGSCDCGCWSSTDRMPEAPDGVVVTVERVSATRAPERPGLVGVVGVDRGRSVPGSVDARASPHADVLGFLALIGVWLN